MCRPFQTSSPSNVTKSKGVYTPFSSSRNLRVHSGNASLIQYTFYIKEYIFYYILEFQKIFSIQEYITSFIQEYNVLPQSTNPFFLETNKQKTKQTILFKNNFYIEFKAQKSFMPEKLHAYKRALNSM